METAKMTPFFQFHYFGPFWSVKYLSFLPKLLIWTAHHTFPESARPQGTKNLYYVSFTRRANAHFFRLQLMDYIGG